MRCVKAFLTRRPVTRVLPGSGGLTIRETVDDSGPLKSPAFPPLVTLAALDGAESTTAIVTHPSDTGTALLGYTPPAALLSLISDKQEVHG